MVAKLAYQFTVNDPRRVINTEGLPFVCGGSPLTLDLSLVIGHGLWI
jgi:hypothetical protein